jgi:hypothetical protein
MIRHVQHWQFPREARIGLICLLLIALTVRPHHTPFAPEGVAPQTDLYRADFYFGGHRVRGTGTPVVLGANAPAGIWARFSPFATAPPAQLPSCLATKPPAAPGKIVSTEIADDLPGLYGAPWVAAVNGNLIAALHVTVPRRAASQPASPVLQIYRKGATQPAFSQTVPVSATRGSNALLYRMFVNGPIACIDLVIPNGAGAGSAHVYYPFRGRMRDAVGVFTVQR